MAQSTCERVHTAVFVGAMRQLEPCKASMGKLSDEFTFEWHGMINCYLELNGLHRFKNDLEWGRIMMRFRSGLLTHEDIDKINKCVIKDENDLPPDIRYATYTNLDRSAINTGLFQKHCIAMSTERQENFVDNCVAIFASDLRVKVGKQKYVKKDTMWETWFFENCGEGNIQTGGFDGRFDPCLLLYYDRPVVVNTNLDVRNGVANGTRAYVVKVELKKNEHASRVVMDDIELSAVHSSQIQRIILKHENPDVDEPYFFLEPKKHSLTAKVPIPKMLQSHSKRCNNFEYIQMTGIQIPIICNNATTGHKLQGCTIKNLFVQSLVKRKNWVYVVLSRVKTMKGLYLREPLHHDDLDCYNAIPMDLQSMIQEFRATKMFHAFSDQNYIDILGFNAFQNLPNRHV